MGPTHAFGGGILVHKSSRQKEFKWDKHWLSFSYFKGWLVHVIKNPLMLILPKNIFWIIQVLTRLQTKEFTIDVSDPKSDRSNYDN